MKEYKIAKGWAIFIYLTAPFLTLIFALLFVLPLIPGMAEDFPFGYFLSFGILTAGMLILSIVIISNTIKAKFVIDKNRVFSISTFSNRELLFREIKGYRIRKENIFIEPVNSYKKKIKISSYFAKKNEIKSWLSENYSDLDLVQAENDKKEILNNPEFGWSEKQRTEKLNEARKIAKITNWIGGIIAAWAFAFPQPYEYAIIATITFPVICLVILNYFKGIIRIDINTDSVYPSIFFSLFMTAMALIIRTIIDFNIYDYANVWIPAVLVLCCYIAILILGNNEFLYSKTVNVLSAFGFLLFMSGYSYGVVVSLNCVYDKSKPEVFKATILDKTISTGKTKSYYLKLTPWNQQVESSKVTVSKDLYNSLNTNTEVNIHYMRGKFDIPWFKITP